jgi:hypothetical protein
VRVQTAPAGHSYLPAILGVHPPALERLGCLLWKPPVPAASAANCGTAALPRQPTQERSVRPRPRTRTLDACGRWESVCPHAPRTARARGGTFTTQSKYPLRSTATLTTGRTPSSLAALARRSARPCHEVLRCPYRRRSSPEVGRTELPVGLARGADGVQAGRHGKSGRSMLVAQRRCVTT